MVLERLNFIQNCQVDSKKHKFSRNPKRNELVVYTLCATQAQCPSLINVMFFADKNDVVSGLIYRNNNIFPVNSEQGFSNIGTLKYRC